MKKTTVLIDLSVIIHQIHQRTEGLEIPKKHYKGVVKAQLLYLMSLEWLGELKPANANAVLLLDSKPYWRTNYLLKPEVVAKVPRKTKKLQALRSELASLLTKEKEYANRVSPELVPVYLELSHQINTLADTLSIHYKAGRSLPTYQFTKLKKAMIGVAKEWGLPMIGVDGYEADDLASLFVRVKADDHRVVLATIDSDWMGLISPSVDWFCTHGWSPRVRTMANYNSWCFRRLGEGFELPSGIWAYKAIWGDKSDNLPPGSPIEVIDLLQPPLEHDLMNRPAIVSQASQLLEREPLSLPEVNRAVNYIYRLGIPLCIRPLDPGLDQY